MDAVAEALSEDPVEIHATLHPRPDGSTSIIAGSDRRGRHGRGRDEARARRPREPAARRPVEKVGAWSSVDRREIETLRGVGQVIDEYVSLYRGGGAHAAAPVGRGLRAPGAGKSFAVKETIGQKVAGGVKTLEFNLSQFNGDQRAAPPSTRSATPCSSSTCRSSSGTSSTRRSTGRELGWLRHFLAPMQDGKFRENGAFHPLGPAIFVFAGGTAASFAEFAAVRDERAEKGAKKPDFVSRLRGYVDILGPNKAHADDRAVVLRRALLLRSLLLRKAPQLVARGGGPKRLLRVDARRRCAPSCRSTGTGTAPVRWRRSST